MARVGTESSQHRPRWQSADRPAPTLYTYPFREPGGSGWVLPGPEPAVKPSGRKPPYRVPSMPEVRSVPRNGLRLVSTFSGCGGSCLGFEMAGYTVLWANEFIPIARQTYEANHPGVRVDDRDIRAITAAEILAATGLAPGELDVLEGSPPCSSFSTAGKRAESWGKSRLYSEGVSQRTDDLFFEFIRLLDGLRPRVFLAENVSGLVKGVAKGQFIEIIRALSALGYVVEARVLDSRWLGVPQMRQRVFFQGVRRDLGRSPAWPRPLAYFYSVRDACPWIAATAHGGELASAAAAAPTVQQHGNPGTFSEFVAVGQPPPIPGVEAEDLRVMLVSENVASRWRGLRPGESHPVNFNVVRSDAGTPAPTLLASHGAPGIFAPVHPTEPRRWTILEAKRICSFPDDFKLLGSFAQRWERLGRSVPPLMMRAVAEVVRDRVLSAGPEAGP